MHLTIPGQMALLHDDQALKHLKWKKKLYEYDYCKLPYLVLKFGMLQTQAHRICKCCTFPWVVLFSANQFDAHIKHNGALFTFYFICIFWNIAALTFPNIYICEKHGTCDTVLVASIWDKWRRIVRAVFDIWVIWQSTKERWKRGIICIPDMYV